MNPELFDEAWRYTPHTFAHKISGGKFENYKHIRYFGTTVASTIAKGNGRLMVHIPPRHGKSTLISQWTPVWYLEMFPQKRVVVAGYAMKIAMEWCRKVRNEFANNPLLKTKLSDDSKSASLWHTPQGGGMMAVGVDCGLSGFGFDLGICDDLIEDSQAAHSVASKLHLYDWYKSTFSTRAEPNATTIMAMTRWSVEDICSTLREEQPEDWTVINLPALAEDNDPMGRKKGEALCPQRYDKKALEKIMVERGAPVWHALYQQRPDPFGAGRLFNRFSAANISDKVALRADLPLAISLDFNINPGNHCIIGQWDAKKDLFIFTDELYGPRMDIRTLIGRLGEWMQAKGWQPHVKFPWPEVHVYGDSTGESEWSGTSSSLYDLAKLELKKMQIPYVVRHLTKNPPLRESIDATNECFRDILEKVHVLIHPRCTGLIKDLQTLQSDIHGLIDKADDAKGHFADCLRYECHYMRPLYGRGAPSKGLVGGLEQR